MCSRGQLLSVLCCLVLGIVVPVSADPAWEYIYEGDTLPDDISLGDDAWQLMGDNQFAEVTDQGELRINDVGQNHCFFLYNIEDAALMEEATIEARVKVLSQSGSANFEVLFGMQDGSNSKWLDLFPDHILLDSSTVTYDVDMTEYHILRMVRNGAQIRIYVDDEEVISEAHVGAGEGWIGFIFGAGCTSCTSEQFWDYLAFTTEGGFSPQELPSYASMRRPAELAGDPSPGNDANDVPCDVTLSWTPGEFAVTHDVYLGTSFEAVDSATPGTLVSQGQADRQYAPETVLEFGRTYYWRVDEVNGAPDNTIFKGEVWSFTVEPFAYPIANVIATSNGASDAVSTPQRTVDGSGINADDQASVKAPDMWLAYPPADEPLWIQYDLGKVYRLHEMLVWNYNVQFELMLGFGLKGVTVEYSENGTDWTALGDFEFARATATATYTANTTVSFGGVAARYVRLNVNSGYGLIGQYGLSEVRFMYIPAYARQPQPADGAADVEIGTALAWRSGRNAASHEVHLGTDPEVLTLADTVGSPTFAPDGIEFGSTYYWQIVEVNEADTVTAWPGDVWTFSTQEYALIDGFETYNDDLEAKTTIFDTWLDGWVNDTGSTVGYVDAPFAERSIVHSGRQSMPLSYDNSASPFYSEAEFDLGGAELTSDGAVSLRLFFHGDAANVAETLYVAIEDSTGKVGVAAHPDPDAALADSWQEWVIPYSELTAGGVNLSRAATIYIGLGDRNNPTAGGTGLVFIDDVGFGTARSGI